MREDDFDSAAAACHFFFCRYSCDKIDRVKYNGFLTGVPFELVKFVTQKIRPIEIAYKTGTSSTQTLNNDKNHCVYSFDRLQIFLCHSPMSDNPINSSKLSHGLEKVMSPAHIFPRLFVFCQKGRPWAFESVKDIQPLLLSSIICGWAGIRPNNLIVQCALHTILFLLLLSILLIFFSSLRWNIIQVYTIFQVQRCPIHSHSTNTRERIFERKSTNIYKLQYVNLVCLVDLVAFY